MSAARTDTSERLKLLREATQSHVTILVNNESHIELSSSLFSFAKKIH